MLTEIHAGLATPMRGVRWLTEVVWDDPYTGPIPVLAQTGSLPLVAAHEGDDPGADAPEITVPGAPSGPAGSIWDALDETQGLPVLSRAALWRRDSVERRTVVRDERDALSA